MRSLIVGVGPTGKSMCVRNFVSLLLSAFLWTVFPVVTLADGLRPPGPYRYLHPPPALARGNNPPLSADHHEVLVNGHQSNAFNSFTADGQFGINADVNGFKPYPSATILHVRIVPVETPPGLPNGLGADGNAYRVTATYIPSGAPAALAHKIAVIVRWPRIPRALYIYDGGNWRQLCDQNSWLISSTLVSCQTASLGTFVAVVHVQVKSASTARSLLPYIAVAIVVVLAGVVAFFVTRRRSASMP